MKRLATLLCLAAALGTRAVWALPITDSASYTVNTFVPDNDLNGLADTRTFSSSIDTITGLRVSLSLSGGFNGDLYAYITHGTGFSVLLNRAGRTGSNGDGYADAGFDVTFDDAAPNGDIHNYQLTLDPLGGALTGTWQPDARTTHPLNTLDTDARSAFLSSFTGLNPNGDWTLYVVDVSPVGTSKLVGWGIDVTGNAPVSTVPESGSTAWLMVFGLGGVCFAARFVPRPALR